MVLATLEPAPGMKCVQHTVLALNSIFMVTGIFLVFVGYTVNNIFKDYFLFVIIVGCLIFAVGVFGCYAAFKLSVAVIMMYCVLLSCILTWEIIAGILGWMLKAHLQNTQIKILSQLMENYQKSSVAATIMDTLQDRFYCCGIQGPEDWTPIFSPHSFREKAIGLPETCCVEYYENDSCPYLRPSGCLRNIRIMSRENILTSIFFIALIQLMGLIFAYDLVCHLRKQKLLGDRFKWEIEQNKW